MGRERRSYRCNNRAYGVVARYGQIQFAGTSLRVGRLSLVQISRFCGMPSDAPFDPTLAAYTAADQRAAARRRRRSATKISTAMKMKRQVDTAAMAGETWR